jgi:hypothetical protein
MPGRESGLLPNRYRQQLAKEGIAFEPLDNGILSCADPKRLQELCDGLSAAKIEAMLRKWLAKLPHPYTATDRQAGYRYAVSILQAEFSLTQVLDRPQTGRIFFEEILRENLDLGRPCAANYPGGTKRRRAKEFANNPSRVRFASVLRAPSGFPHCSRSSACPSLSDEQSASCRSLLLGRCRSANHGR